MSSITISGLPGFSLESRDVILAMETLNLFSRPLLSPLPLWFAFVEALDRFVDAGFDRTSSRGVVGSVGGRSVRMLPWTLLVNGACH